MLAFLMAALFISKEEAAENAAFPIDMRLVLDSLPDEALVESELIDMSLLELDF